MVEPGGYWTDLYTAMRYSDPPDSYAVLREELTRQYSEGSVDSDPSLAAEKAIPPPEGYGVSDK